MVNHDIRKEQIIDKAIELFSEKGYYKTTSGQVAQAVGVTQPYVYYFFKNKEELFKAVIDKAVQRLYESFSTFAEAPADLIIDQMGEAFDEILQNNRQEILLIMLSQSISEPEIRQHVREKYRFMHEEITKIIRQSGIADPEIEAAQFIGMGLMITTAEVLDLPQLRLFKED
ncbi:TetR/AcrR family transcriptional regulator [Paenibacillaceae bacterium]|nr:TetR/AcrR family transcriptional regulator [Paenibacillaceae bacterium]